MLKASRERERERERERPHEGNAHETCGSHLIA